MMITKTLWKDMIRAIKKSKGRFFSLMCLMALGSFALVGLKVTGPDMERTASHYLEKQQVMDMAVLASHQFSQEDRKELNSLKDVVLEYGHLIDLNITKTSKLLGYTVFQISCQNHFWLRALAKARHRNCLIYHA